MRNEAFVFNVTALFFVVMAFIYGWLTDFNEWVGFPAILLVGGLTFMIGTYFRILAKRHGARPEDRDDGDVAELSGEQGVYAPWSWWPLVLGGATAMGFLALAAGWWIMVPAVLLVVIGLPGWVFEFSKGQHRH